MSVAAILLAAGKGSRLGAPVEKGIVALAGRPLFAWSLEALQKTAAIEAIVVVGPVARMKDALAASGCSADRIVAWCEGGRERQQSVALGLSAVPPGLDLILVHDAARALVTPSLIARCIGDALAHGAAIAAAPLEDTIKRVTLKKVETTVPRAGLWRVQTPQVFRRDWLQAAHAAATGIATDDAGLLEAIGKPIHVTASDGINFKITTPADLALAEAWLSSSPVKN